MLKSLPSPGHILAVAPNWLGDVAMATPALRAIARQFPDARLSVAARQGACDLLAGLPWISDTLSLTARPRLREMRRASAQLAGPPDLAVIFPHSFRAACFAWISGARRRVGYARGGRIFLLTDQVEPYRENGRIVPIYMAEEYLGLARAVGAEDDGVGLELATDPAADAEVCAALPEGVPVVALCPGAAFGPSKCWPAERFAAVADVLHAQADARCLLLTGPGEEETRAAVLRAAKHSLIDVQGARPSLAKLKAAIARSDLLIGNDSGPRHIAIAFKRPVVCIMGPTSPRYTTSLYERGEVLRVDVPCGPCQKPVCSTDHRCMTSITPEQVVAAALRLL